MSNQLLKDVFGWGFIVWLVGYILGFLFFFAVPQEYLGWVIMPFGVLFALWVLFRRVTYDGYILIALVWTAMAFVLDYIFIVKVLKPADGYYKLDVYVYYLLTFALPLIVGRWKKK